MNRKNSMKDFLDLLKIVLPAAAVIYAMYLMARSFIRKEIAEKQLDIKREMSKAALPTRLQAFERMCLFLERISLNNLLLRLNQGNIPARQLQPLMIHEIREEYNHNLSQQIYMSNESWDMIKNTVEQVISIINSAAEGMDEKASGLDLAKKIVGELSENGSDPTEATLTFVKNEIRSIF